MHLLILQLFGVRVVALFLCVLIYQEVVSATVWHVKLVSSLNNEFKLWNSSNYLILTFFSGFFFFEIATTSRF